MRRGTSADRVDLLEEAQEDAEPVGYGTHETERAAVRGTDLTVTSFCRQWATTVLLGCVKSWWKTMVIMLTPLLLLPLQLVWKDQTYPNVSSAAYVMLVMAVYWITEAVPLVVTALLPLILLPALGVLTAKQAALRYLTDTNMLFLAGLMMAVAIEKWDLHRRIALRLLLLVGSKPRWLLLGFMLSSTFLSMWISNTATAAMMLAIAHAVLEEMKDVQLKASIEETRGATPDPQQPEASPDGQQVGLPSEDGQQKVSTSNDMALEKTTSFSPAMGGAAPSGDSPSVALPPAQKTANNERHRSSLVAPDGTFDRLCKGLMLGVTYSANVGGIGTLTGTGPNLLLRENAVSLFPSGPGINYGSWFIFGVPMVIVITFCSWIYLSALYCDDSFQWLKWKLLKRPPRSFSGETTKGVIQHQYHTLGPIRWAEILILVFQVVLILLWVLRDPKVFPGWSSLFKTDTKTNDSYVSDATVGLFVVFLLFVIPSQPCCYPFRRGPTSIECSLTGVGSSPKLLDWDTVQQKLPWNVVILLGAGFVLAEASRVSGLTCWVGSKLLGLESLAPASIAFLITVLVAVVTEVLSNTATATLFLPVVASLAVSLKLHPLYLMIPITVASSFAFMLPIATPPNAIAFSYKYIKVLDMVRTGFLMNIFAIVVVTAALNTIAIPIFDLGMFPQWANQTNNATCVAS